MNYKALKYILGRLFLVFGFLLLFPLVVSFIYKEPLSLKMSFFWPIVILTVLGIALTYKEEEISQVYAKEGLVIVALFWILMSFFGGLPLVLSKTYPTMVDAFFEISSGLTTTGASVATDVEALPHSILFWRSFTHLIGGMGVLVFALAILPRVKNESLHLMKAEVPGPVFGKIVSKIGNTARILYIIYLVMTAVLVVILILAGMPVFDSLLHAFGTAGTGGFGIKANSIGYYNSATIDIILGVGMLVFGVNFGLYYLILIGKVKDFFKSEELKWYLGIVLIAIIVITINIHATYEHLPKTLQDVFFTVSSIITTTGYSTADFDKWPLFSHIILLILMFVGGMSGSTAGGLKVYRIGSIVKSGLSEIKRTSNPKRVLPVLFENKVIDQKLMRGLFNYLSLYISIFIVLLLIVSLDTNRFIGAFSAVAATFNNIGPGLEVVGPTQSFASLSQLSKVALSIGMIAGRLEIYPILVLFSPRTWRKK